MLPTDPPRPTAKARVFDSLDGMILYGDGSTPFLLQIHEGPLAIPVFSTLERAVRFAIEFSDLLDSRQVLKRIDDTRVFLESVTGAISVVIDCHRTAQGTVRYQEVRLAGLPCGLVSLPDGTDN